MNIKKTITITLILILFIDAVVFFTVEIHPSTRINANNSESAAVKDIDSTIIAEGTVTAQNEADLHFQTAGKLVSVPFKEGDSITQGQTIAQLDTYPLQQQLSEALDNYQSTRDQFDQSQQNENTNVTQNVQKGQDNFYGGGPEAGDNNSNANYFDDLAKRIVDENQANLNNSVISVQIANYALQMATLTSPLTGVVTHEDVTVAGQNVSPTTTFSVADPNSKVFRANVPASDIDFVSVGMNASIILDGVQNKINGTVTNIYPSKVTLPDGEDVYQVDIQSDDIKNTGKLDQSGTAIIMTNAQNVILVPAWTVLSGKYIWVNNNGTPELRTVTVGKIHGNDIEVTSGLSKNDRVITDPNVISAKKYQLL
jgi:multidrug efflux pump subunit AcrA (membrane-fusion protein)